MSEIVELGKWHEDPFNVKTEELKDQIRRKRLTMKLCMGCENEHPM